MYPFYRSLLFRLDPESAHQLTLNLLRAVSSLTPARWLLQALFSVRSKPVTAFDLTFKNQLGLAAGYDKDGLALRGLAALGFGHIEVGTVTPLPQAGNPKPRLFRLVEDEALINRMGFPSRGAAFLLGRMRRPDRAALRRAGTILGINLGKNKHTSNEEAVFDYLALLQNFAPFADYLAINVSSPNTEGLRNLQGRADLESLLTQLDAQRRLEEKKLMKRLPLLVKLAPDLDAGELDGAVEVILRTGMDGIIAVNTTLGRENLRSVHLNETGGLSGSPLKVRSEAVLQQIVQRVEGKIPIISVGGIMSPADARRRLDMGAALVQLYTGLIYLGPGLVRQVLKSM